ncbi:MAG: 1-acyl-sn-glycerol-3-phosphate acyltransferase [Propionivibrio sp.]|nr:1-acyl-sn-glycerol-3-phosphate acyltransferase [Propionivibrio sp.]
MIVCNHVSFVDALVVMAACPRPIRFVMDHQIFNWLILSFVFRPGAPFPLPRPRTIRYCWKEHSTRYPPPRWPAASWLQSSPKAKSRRMANFVRSVRGSAAFLNAMRCR